MKLHGILFWTMAGVGSVVAVSADASNVDHIQAPTNSLVANPSCWSTGYSTLTATCSGTTSVLLNVDNISPGDNTIQAWVTLHAGSGQAGQICCQLTSVNDDLTSAYQGSNVCTGGGVGTWQTQSLGSVYVPYTAPGTTLGNFGYSYIYCTATTGMEPVEIGAVHYKD